MQSRAPDGSSFAIGVSVSVNPSSRGVALRVGTFAARKRSELVNLVVD